MTVHVDHGPSDADSAAAFPDKGNEEDRRDDGADKATGYPAKLQQLFEENGINMNVQDNTWDMAGSLSQLALAGVSQDIIDGYIAQNPDKVAAMELEVPATETVVRDDLADFFVAERDDLDYIPVICMGYFGGWGYDPVELAAQQQNILDTYNQQDRFVIVGVYPNAAIDTAYYDQVMAETWGEHYLPMSWSVGTVYYEEGHEQFAQVLYDKLSELGYLGDAQPAENTEAAPAEETPAEEAPAEEAPAEETVTDEAAAGGEAAVTEEFAVE